MCIICASRINVRQPGEAAIRRMFANNPHGAGYMFARNGKVHIHKGYMDVESFLADIRAERFTAKDPVVYHFRISTQAGVNPQMTHPFPLSNRRAHMKALDVDCQCGIAHNGIIRLTTVRHRAQQHHPPDHRPDEPGVQRYGHLHYRLPCTHYPHSRRPSK